MIGVAALVVGPHPRLLSHLTSVHQQPGIG